jgi:hypothetical protein
MPTDLTTIFAQFGPAGLMGLLWIMERRHAATRERQLTEAHQRLSRQDDSIHALLEVVRDNTRAITSLEHTQRHLLHLARGMNERLNRPIRPGSVPAATATEAAA